MINRDGLVRTRITNKNGISTHVWKRRESQKASSGNEELDFKSDFSHNHDSNETPFEMELTRPTEEILEVLSRSGYSPFLVGGCVRDSIVGKPSKDVDIEVYGVKSQEELVKKLKSHGAHVDEVGASFGIIKCNMSGEEFDVSLPRRDSLADGENSHRSINAEVDPSLTPEEASTRRDFTMNALMYDPFKGVIVDYHGGVQDIDDRIIRAVDENSFIEDPLRALRAVQFSSRFSMDIDPETISICRSMKSSGLARERIAEELRKMILKSSDIERGFQSIDEIGWNNVVPSINCGNYSNKINQKIVDEINNSSFSSNGKMALLAYIIQRDKGFDNSASTLERDLMMNKKERNLFKSLTSNDIGSTLGRSRIARNFFTENVSQEDIDSIFFDQDNLAEKIWAGNPPKYIVDGKMLSDMKIPPGPIYSSIISHFRDRQDSGENIDKSSVLKYIQDKQNNMK